MSTKGFESWTLQDVQRWNESKGVMPSARTTTPASDLRASVEGGVKHPPDNTSRAGPFQAGGAALPSAARPEPFNSANGRQTRSKYRNVRCQVDGQQFDSRHEAETWLMLKAREQAGEILNLQRQIPIPLHCPSSTAGHLELEVAQYVADFTWYDHEGQAHVGDAKASITRTRTYMLKAKWLRLEYGLTVEEL